MKALILAGGKGTRLWPLSRSHFPKQFLQLGKEHSLLEQTVQRTLQLVKKEDLFILTNQEYFHEVQSILPEGNILVEPSQKNTAPAIAWALRFLKENHALQPTDVICVLPADHFIAPQEAFHSYLLQAKEIALSHNHLVTLGIRPLRAETGYGYIKASGNRVEAFFEKPTSHVAEEYFQNGQFFWNAGIFVFKAGVMEQELEKHAPDIFNGLKHFSKLPSLSIDKAVLEKSDCLSMVPIELNWSDMGSWDNVYETLEKDENQNVTQGDVQAIDTTNSLIFAEKRLVSTVGLDQMLVIETADAVLVARREDSQKVKELVEALQKKGRKEVDEHVTSQRPWGSFTVLEEAPRYKIKKIQVNPLEQLSLQLHYHRSEHWVVVSGTAKVTIGEDVKIVHEGESIFVPKSSRHRVENPGKVPLEIIEVQVGEYLGEDDIVRLDDRYGRARN